MGKIGGSDQVMEFSIILFFIEGFPNPAFKKKSRLSEYIGSFNVLTTMRIRMGQPGNEIHLVYLGPDNIVSTFTFREGLKKK